MSNDKAKGILKNSDTAFTSTERKNAEHIWERLSEYIMPNQSGVFLGEPANSKGSTLGSGGVTGGKKTARLFDSTAIQANSDLSATMHSTLTNPATQWSKIRYQDEILNNTPEAVAWLQECNRRIHNKINESNFDTEVSRAYKTFNGLGNGILFEESMSGEEDLRSGLHFKSMHLSQVAWEENQWGIVDTMYRKFSLTGRQVIQKFPNTDKELLMKAQEKPAEMFHFVHAVFPRKPTEVKFNEFGMARPEDRPYASIYVNADDKDSTIVEENGYYEFPAFIFRFDLIPGEKYGRGPGHIALPDIRTLNRLVELDLQATNKAVNPPILVNKRDFLSSLDLRPNRISIVDDVQQVRQLEVTSRFDVIDARLQRLQQSVQRMFFLDKLLLPPRQDTGEMTATEIQVRTEQMQRVLGPTLGRLSAELLNPLILRTFRILKRAGELPPLPEIFQGQAPNVEIVFLNQLARSQQFGDITNILGWFSEVAQAAQIDPAALVRVDVDAGIKHIAKVRAIPESVVRTDDEVKEILQQQQQAAQMQQGLEAGVKAADIQSKTSE